MTMPGPTPSSSRNERGQVEIVNGSHPHYASSTSVVANNNSALCTGGASRVCRRRFWMRDGRRGGVRVGPDPNLPHWRPTYSLPLPTSPSILTQSPQPVPFIAPLQLSCDRGQTCPAHLRTVRDISTTQSHTSTVMRSLTNAQIPFGSRASNTRATSHSNERRRGGVRVGGQEEDRIGRPGEEVEELHQRRLGRERQRVREHL